MPFLKESLVEGNTSLELQNIRLEQPADMAEKVLDKSEVESLLQESQPGSLSLRAYRMLLKALRKETRDALFCDDDTGTTPVRIESDGLNAQAFCAAVDVATRALERSIPCRAITVQGCQNEICGVYEYHGIVNQTAAYKSSPAQTATLFNSAGGSETVQKSNVLICPYWTCCFSFLFFSFLFCFFNRLSEKEKNSFMHAVLRCVCCTDDACFFLAAYRPKNVWELDNWMRRCH